MAGSRIVLPMNETNLHSSRLERLVGKISCELISQEGDMRKVHLRDSAGISKTLGIVRFANVNGENLINAHRRIIKGDLLGKTLYEARIDFDKLYLGYVRVELPDWLRKEFANNATQGIALFSRIFVNGTNGHEHNNLYADVIEVIPPSLQNDFVNVAPLLADLEKGLEAMLLAAGIRNENLNGN